MSKTTERAARARRLAANSDFQEFLTDTRSAQLRVFSDPHSTSDGREDAHAIVRALAKLEVTLETAMSAENFEKKKG